MIEVANLSKKYGKFTVLQNVTCSFAAGRIYGIIGYNGAGKTSFLKTVAGIYRADSGKVTVEGKDVFDNPAYQGRCFNMGEDLFFKDQADLKTMCRFMGGYYPAWEEGIAVRLNAIFKLPVHQKLSGFSKGMQRQAGLLLGLSTSPEYLFLDESFDGLDWEKRDVLAAVLRAYAEEKGATILVTSHYLRELQDVADQFILVENHTLKLLSKEEADEFFTRRREDISSEIKGLFCE